MTQNTIPDLLTKSLNSLVEIEDNVGPVAGDEYMQDKIMYPIKLLATSFFSDTGYKFLNSVNSDPNFDDLQTLLNTYTSTTAFGTTITLAVLIKKQLADLNMTVSTNRINTFISSLTKDNFYIKLTASTINRMHFKDIELKLNNNVSLTNCIIENCKITSTGTFYISGTNISNSIIDTSIMEIRDLCDLYNNKIKTSNSLVFNISYTNSKMLNCYTNKIPTNESNNSTMEFNTYVANL